MARDLGAGFVRILEPRSVGRWSGRDVDLKPEQVEGLLRFARRANSERSDFPIVDLPALDQRTLGCFGAGDRYLFVDALGFVHACPFCRESAGKASAEDLGALRARLRLRGCQAFFDAQPLPAKVQLQRRRSTGSEA
jgi:MoaA/NifB/PqqE/SkfB family radical SAM enzyme